MSDALPRPAQKRPLSRDVQTVTAPPAKSRSAPAGMRPYRRTQLFMLFFGAFLLGCATARTRAMDPPLAAEFTFEKHEVVIGSAPRQTVLTGFLLGGAIAELAVLSVDDQDDRRLRIFAFGDGGWAPRLDATLRPDVLFVDVANIDGRDRLIVYESGRLSWFDPESATTSELAAVRCRFNPPPRREVPHVDFTRDVNGDGRDDLVAPDVDGFWMSIQMSDGAFADPVKLGPPTKMDRIYGDGYRYDPWSQSRIHEIDYNRDGRVDLAFWNGDRFEVHLQNDHGLFTPTAKTFTTDVAFDSDDLSSLAAGDMRGKVLHSLADLNGDGVADLVVFSLEGANISRKRSVYEAHFGARTPDGGLAFTSEAGAMFRSEGAIQLGMDRHDFDRDGQVDLMLTTIETRFLESSLWKNIKGFMGDDIWLGLEFYRMEAGRYPDKPNATRRIALDGAPSHREPGWVPLDIALQGGAHKGRRAQKRWPRAFNRTLLIGDVTGDGRSDLLIESTHKQLRVYIGAPGPDLFARRPQTVAVDLPNDKEYAWLADLNKDGKQDLLLHQPFTERDAHGAPMRRPGTEPHRVTVLLSR